MEELRLPKCLTEKERRGILEYNEKILNNFSPSEREGMSKEIYVLQDRVGLFFPYPEYSPWGDTLSLSFEEDTTNKALYKALRKVLTLTQEGYENGDMALFFNRAYAIATHVLNNGDSVYTLKSYLKIWDNYYDSRVLFGCGYGVRFSQLNSELCKHICASMVYCILDNEDDSRPDELLQEIEWLLQASQDGIDTLKVFQEKVATANEQTEENTQVDEQPKAEPPLEKEEEAAPTLSDDDIKTAICTLQEEGYLDEKVRYLGVHKVLVNRGVCDNNLSDFGRYMLKLGFAEKVSHGKVKKRETTDIYEIIKKVPAEFRNQRLSEWLDTREKQDAKLQKITDTARRLSQLIPSHKK